MLYRDMARRNGGYFLLAYSGWGVDIESDGKRTTELDRVGWLLADAGLHTVRSPHGAFDTLSRVG
jgi:hypothetical protein